MGGILRVTSSSRGGGSIAIKSARSIFIVVSGTG